MALIFDRRAQLAGQSATHAFIIGVSEYDFLPGSNAPPSPTTFGLKKLASPALSAAKICNWLVVHADELAKPLASCRLLISPSAIETPLLPRFPQVPGVIPAVPASANWAHFVYHALAWRTDCSLRRDDSTIFYYSGHGLQRLGVPLLTLADFCDPAAGGRLMRSVELSNIVGGMAPSATFPQIARTQFYFVDACREEVDQQGLQTNTGSVFDVLQQRDDRTTPTYQATYPGSVAQAKIGYPTDFCEGLLQGLEQGAEYRDAADIQRRWPVTTYSLHNALTIYFASLNTGQYAPLSGGPLGAGAKNVNLRWLSVPPKVAVFVTITPDPAVDCTAIEFSGAAVRQQAPRRSLHPYKMALPAGIYQLKATSETPNYRPFQDAGLINQQNARWTVSMEAA